MRVLVPAVVAALVAACAFPAWSAQTGGLAAPLQAGTLALSAGLTYGQRDVEDGGDDQVVSRRVLFRAEYGVADGIGVHGTVGLTDADFDDADFEGGLGETFGVGVRFGLLNFAPQAVKVVLDLQGEYFHSEDGSKDVWTQTYHGAAYVVKEFGAAGRIGYVYPYGGIRVSYAHYGASGDTEDFTSEDFVGVFGGVDYFVTPEVFFSGELHLFDETSLYLGVGYRF